MTDDRSSEDQLLETLGEAQRLGFFGAGSLLPAVTRAERFCSAIPPGTRNVIDVGAGGGLPGLVIATERPQLLVTLLDRRERRADFLRRAVSRLGISERVEVVCGDAARLGHDPRRRERYDVAVARGLGQPAVTAELCRGFVSPGGLLVVAEPPPSRAGEDHVRWPEDGLRRCNLARRSAEVEGVAVFEAVGECPSALPRRHQRPRLW